MMRMISLKKMHAPYQRHLLRLVVIVNTSNFNYHKTTVFKSTDNELFFTCSNVNPIVSFSVTVRALSADLELFLECICNYK